MTDGPYLETKEVIGGFWVIDTPDLDMALKLAAELTLRLLGGLSVAEIAQAFLVPETTMAQRMARAKKKIARATDPG